MNLLEKKVNEALGLGLINLGLQRDVKIVEVKKNRRVVLSYTQDLKYPDFGKNMIRLERFVSGVLGFNVDLTLEAKEDKNKREQRTARA